MGFRRNPSWSGMAAPMMPMAGEILNQEDRDRRDRERAAQSDLYEYARGFGLQG